MKMIYTLIVLMLLSLSCTESAFSSDPFLEFMQQFYKLDDQQFNQITCQVEVPEFAALRAQMKSHEKRILVKENFDEFRLTYTRGKGLTFNLPSFEVFLISEEGINDRNKVETGMQMMRDGAKQTVQGVVQTLEGLFEAYQQEEKNKISNVEIVKNENETLIRYEKKGAKVTRICTDRNCKTSAVQPLLQFDSDDHYDMVDNKLIIKSSRSTIKNNLSTINTQVSIEYQKVNSVLFPSNVTANSEIVLPNMKQEGRSSILLKDCKAAD